jgi:hypothetical protein
MQLVIDVDCRAAGQAKMKNSLWPPSWREITAFILVTDAGTGSTGRI